MEQAPAPRALPGGPGDLSRDPVLRGHGSASGARHRSLLLRHAGGRSRRGRRVLGPGTRAPDARAGHRGVPGGQPRGVLRPQRRVFRGLPGPSERRLPAHGAARPVRRRPAQCRPGCHLPRAGAGGRATPLRMIDTAEQRHATTALRLLLDQGGSPPPDMTVDWPLLLTLARQNSVLVRLSERLEGRGLRPPAFFAAAAERARQRADTASSVMRHIADRCARHGIDFLFPTAWQHFPDAGGDLDLLVSSRARRVDALILEGMAASLRAPDLRDRRAGTALYWLRESGLALDVHHGRLGVVGVAHHMGVLPGLCCYLSYVDEIYGALYGPHLLPPEARQVLTIDGWGSVAFREGRYRFASLRVRNRLYWRQLATVAAAGEWRVASRLCLVPARVVACSLGLVGRNAVEATASITALAMGAL